MFLSLFLILIDINYKARVYPPRCVEHHEVILLFDLHREIVTGVSRGVRILVVASAADLTQRKQKEQDPSFRRDKIRGTDRHREHRRIRYYSRDARIFPSQRLDPRIAGGIVDSGRQRVDDDDCRFSH